MTGRPKVSWRVPENEWNVFVNYVERERGENERYVREEVERAMREYIDADEYASIEGFADQLLEAAGYSCETFAAKKPTLSGNTKSVQRRVDADLKDLFRQHAKVAGNQFGLHLTYALRERRNGGRSQRLTEKLMKVLEDAEDLLAELDPASEGMNTIEKRTVVICKSLEEQFTRSDLENAISVVAGESGPTVRQYTEKVLDRRNYVEHPNNPDLFISKKQREEIAASEGIDLDAPAIDWKDCADLTDEERVHGLRVKLARRAAERTNRKSALRTETIRAEVFNEIPGKRKTRSLINQARRAGGFETDCRGGTKRLRCDLDAVADSDVLADLDFSGTEDADKSGEQEMSALMDATPVSNSGDDR